MSETTGDPLTYGFPTFTPYTYSPAMLVIGPCEKCGRNYVIVNPVDRQPLPKTCRECD